MHGGEKETRLQTTIEKLVHATEIICNENKLAHGGQLAAVLTWEPW